MKILLVAVNAKYIHSNPAVYSLKKFAGEWEKNIEIAEYTINNSLNQVLLDIYSRKAEVICFSCYIWNIAIVEELTWELSKLCPGLPIWLGGPEVSFETKGYLSGHPHIKGIMIGEGEATFRELCQYYLENNPEKSLSEIPGLSLLDNGIIINTPLRECLDLDEIPFYYDNTKDFENRIIYYESSRGCPFSCSYCLSSIDKKLRFRSLDKVRNELKYFLDNGVKQVKFVDRTFNCNENHALGIWKYIKENDNGITNFHFEISADLLTDEEMVLLKSLRPGLVQLEIGVQSTNEKTLKEIHRSMDLLKLRENVREINKTQNIHQHLDLIAGLPHEDYESFGESFNSVISLRPHQLQLGFLKVLKGSLMHEKANEYGLVYRQKPPYEVLKTNWLSFDDIIKLKSAEEMLEVYYNSGQYPVALEILLQSVKNPFEFFVNFGKFSFEKGYNSMSLSRIKRCENLLEFIESREFSGLCKENYPDKSMIKEALVFDLYSRENCKSRPSWARDKGELKEMTKLYCKKGTRSHIEPFLYDFDKVFSGDEPVKKLKEPIWILFDYDNINPVTKRAEYTKIYPNSMVKEN